MIHHVSISAREPQHHVIQIIPHEDILDIDERGDTLARMPHVYLQSVLLRDEKGFHENLLRLNLTRIRLPEERRVKFFPDEFPDPPPVDNTVPEQ